MAPGLETVISTYLIDQKTSENFDKVVGEHLLCHMIDAHPLLSLFIIFMLSYFL